MIRCPHCRVLYTVAPKTCHCCKAPMHGAPDVKDVSLRAAFIQQMADALIADADRYGIVLTIENKNLLPLAMGNHHMVASVRPARECQPLTTQGWTDE